MLSDAVVAVVTSAAALGALTLGGIWSLTRKAPLGPGPIAPLSILNLVFPFAWEF